MNTNPKGFLAAIHLLRIQQLGAQKKPVKNMALGYAVIILLLSAMPNLKAALSAWAPLPQTSMEYKQETFKVGTTTFQNFLVKSNYSYAVLLKYTMFGNVSGQAWFDTGYEQAFGGSGSGSASLTYDVYVWDYSKNAQGAKIASGSLNGGGGPDVKSPRIALRSYDDEISYVSGLSTLQFGDCEVGQIGNSFILKIVNTGTDPLIPSQPTLTGVNAGDFTVGPLSNSSITPISLNTGESTTFLVTFSPNARGTRTATLNIPSNDTTKNPFKLKLAGKGIAPVIGVKPSAIDFKTAIIPTYVTSDIPNEQCQLVTVTNSGDAVLGFSSELEGANPDDFVLGAGAFNDVFPGGSVTFSVCFRPKELGTRNARIRIESNAGTTPVYVTLQGIGKGTPEINVQSQSEGSLEDDAGTVDLGCTPLAVPVTETFTITNSGNDVLGPLGTKMAGLNASEFTLGSMGKLSLAPGESATFSVSFKPQKPGQRTGKIIIESNDADENPFEINVLGCGLTPEIDVNGLSDNGVDAPFQDTATGSARSRTYVVSNLGDGDLAVRGIGLSGTHKSEFVVGSLNKTIIPPSQSASFTVTFRPLAKGKRTAKIQIFNNDENEDPFDINLNGYAYAVPDIHVDYSSGVALDSEAGIYDAKIDFGSAGVGSTMPTRTLRIKNGGTGDLINLTLLKLGTHGEDFIVGKLLVNKLTPGQFVTIPVAFSPKGQGARGSYILSIGSNDPDEDPYRIALSGTGTAATPPPNPGAIPAPTVTSISPTSGPTTGGTSVTITGTNLTGATGVTIGGAAARSVMVVSATSITCTTPAGTKGTKSVVVTTPGGSNVSNSLFTYIAAAPGDIDPLNTDIPNTNNVLVRATTVQPDGKVLIGGRFAQVLGVPRNSIARINADGTLDAIFNPSLNANGDVDCITVQADGKVIIGGFFTSLQPNGAASATARNNIARVNADGTLDATFNPNVNSDVRSIAVQADGKVIIGGSFYSQVLGVPRKFIARINANGTLDATFNPNVNNDVRSIAVQADGKVIIGGGFTKLQPNGAASATARNNIARVNADGTLDATFNPNANGDVDCITVQADGKVIIGGFFTSLQPNGAASATARKFLARVNADGTLDATFNPNANGLVRSIAVQADGKVIIGGGFSQVQGVPRNSIARLNANGTLDMTFNPNVSGGLLSVALQADGKVLLGGFISSLQPNGATSATARNRFARVNNDAATQTLTAPNTAQVLWIRSGAGPEVSHVIFEQSTNGGATWTTLGQGTRVGITSNWQLSGLALPATGQLRARGRTTDGLSSGLIEQIAALSFTPPPPAPALSSISPTSGSITGGTSVTITGRNFTGATGVTIGGMAATSVMVVSPTSITCTTPAGTMGTKSVVVTTPGGSNAANALFTYIAAPAAPRITSPRTGATISHGTVFGNLPTGTIEVVGTVASPPTGQALTVQFSVNGGTSWANASMVDFYGTLFQWKTPIVLQPGANAILFRVVYESGSVSKNITVSYFYSKPSPLKLVDAVDGTVTSGFSGDSTRLLGVAYSITATPKAGMVFKEWLRNGLHYSRSANISFTMEEGLVLTPVFIPNPFPVVAGTYNGLVGAGTESDRTEFFLKNGFVTITVDSKGTISGAVRLQGQSLTLVGKLDGFGEAVLTLKRPGKSDALVALAVDLTAAAAKEGSVIGTVTPIGAGGLNFTALPGVYTGVPPSIHPLSGKRYTVILPAPGAAFGHGYATVVFDAKGLATFAGKLADVTGFTASVRAADDLLGHWVVPIHIPLYTGLGGMLSGEIRIPQIEPLSAPDVNGSLKWLRPANPQAILFPSGFLETLLPLGERYQLAKDISLLSGDALGGNFTLAIDPTMTALTSPLTTSGSWPNNNKPFVTAPIPTGLMFTFTGETGVFKGNFLRPINGKTISTPYEGVVLGEPFTLPGQTGQNLGGGFFSTGNALGKVVITRE
jgi:uncharacterized delta-60 repeat protein